MPHRFVLGLVLALAACTSPRPPAKPSSAEPLDPKAAVARFNGETITAGELEETVKKDLRRVEAEHQERLYQTRRQGLEGLIAQKLVEAKAKALGTTPEALIKQETEPTEAEITSTYDGAKARGGQQLPPLEKIRDQVAGFIKQQKAQAFYRKLYTEAKAEVLLPPYRPPRMEVAAEGPSKGPEKAPVTIVEFSDYECPFCGRAEGTVAQVLGAYGDKVRLVYRDFPLPMHPHAEKAAEAAHCAGDQGKYWEMHGRLFANQQDLDVSALKKHAGELKLDQARFDNCLDSGAKAKVVEANRKAGEEVGVTGTPAFFVNGMMISGARPFEDFKSLIDSELAQK